MKKVLRPLSVLVLLSPFLHECTPKKPSHESSAETSEKEQSRSSSAGSSQPDNPVVDCDRLASIVRGCALQLAEMGEPGVAARVRAMNEPLRSRVFKGIKEGLLFRIVSPCKTYRGQMPQNSGVKRCLDLVSGSSKKDPKEKGSECLAFVACLKPLLYPPLKKARQ